jgi:putative RNA 2'-phosphotransferase
METPSSHIIKRGKKLSYLLRHDTSYAFDKHGWRSVNDLIANHGFSLEELHEIVATNNKQRYEFSGDMKFIRARQGHSINVDVELAEEVPPVVLYHGTPKENLPSILDKGICKMSRNHVHLSDTKETASKVGARRGKDFVVLSVGAKQMHEDGFVFYLSRNLVWLTEYVPVKYLLIIPQ